jgi:hypothetical protein
VVAQQWWALDGSGPRCYQMLAQYEKPPLMLYLMWLEYTQLAKQIATAAIFGSSADRATATMEAVARIENARDPDELPA